MFIYDIFESFVSMQILESEQKYYVVCGCSLESQAMSKKESTVTGKDDTTESRPTTTRIKRKAVLLLHRLLLRVGLLEDTWRNDRSSDEQSAASQSKSLSESQQSETNPDAP